ncbi:MAG: DUF302 domain-containing protein [Pseudomonadota bacterium]|uniref:DUF302 domain-containing protein n=1 Tax=Methylophaga aminisulfidivorans TaxID=230105 RepID=UPI0024E24983|nr:DUF302 domain-containing protein [Methylophaga aminisulfidivorans]MEC9412789.1 DUF302 domain-containing protein [Pseudomonadota bacterium]
MEQIKIDLPVNQTVDFLKQSIQEKGLTLFCDIDHQANAKKHELDMPASHVLIFGNPKAGTPLMQKDINVSIELPLRLAAIENKGETLLIYPNVKDYSKAYLLGDHPVLDKMQSIFDELVAELKSFSKAD